MNEPDILGAVEAAARATVAPPFGVVEHRMHVHRRRQIASVAAAITVVLAGGALAMPRIEARDATPANGGQLPAGGGRLKPYEQFGKDPRDVTKYHVCRATITRSAPPLNAPRASWSPINDEVARCFREAGYEPPDTVVDAESRNLHPTIVAVPVNPPTEENHNCAGVGDVNRSVVEGRTRTLSWQLAVESPVSGSGSCFFMELLAREDGGADWKPDTDGGSFGDEQMVRWATWETAAGETLLGMWGAVDPEADHVEFTVEGVRRKVDVVHQPGLDTWRFVATMFPVDRVDPDTWTVIAYDKNGAEVERVKEPR